MSNSVRLYGQQSVLMRWMNLEHIIQRKMKINIMYLCIYTESRKMGHSGLISMAIPLYSCSITTLWLFNVRRNLGILLDRFSHLFSFKIALTEKFSTNSFKNNLSLVVLLLSYCNCSSSYGPRESGNGLHPYNSSLLCHKKFSLNDK